MNEVGSEEYDVLLRFASSISICDGGAALTCSSRGLVIAQRFSYGGLLNPAAISLCDGGAALTCSSSRGLVR